MSYKNIQISTETYDVLCSFQTLLKKIMKKKKISMDMIIKVLLSIKIDASDLLIEIEKQIRFYEEAQQ